MKEFNIKLAKTISIIEESELHKDTAEICKGFKESHILFLTSYFGITVAVAIADKKLFNSELEYISKGIPKEIQLDEHIKNSLIELNVSKALLANGYSTTIPHYIEYLKNTIKKKDIIKIVKRLFAVGCADGSLVSSEVKLINHMAKRFNLSDLEIKQIRNNCIRSKLTRTQTHEDKEVTLIKRLKKTDQFFQKKRFVNPLKDNYSEEYFSKLNQSPLFFFIKQTCTDVEFEDLLFITSYLGTAFSLISSNQNIHEKEIAYIKNNFSQWYDLKEDTLNTLIDINVYLTEKKTHTDKHTQTYIEILSQIFDNQEKERFTIMLINLSLADDKVSPIELLTIELISSAFNLDNQNMNKLKDNAIGIDGSFRIIRSASSWDMND